MPSTPEGAPEPSPRARRAVRWSLGLLALTLLLLMVGPQWGLLTLVVAPVMAGAMVTSLVLLRGVRLTALKVMLGVGIGVAAIAMLYGLGLVIFRGPVQELTDCQARAITETARRTCLVEYEQAYRDQLEEWGLTVP